MTAKSSGFFYGRKEALMSDGTIYHMASNAMTLTQKGLTAMGANVGLSILAIFDYVPVIAPAVSLVMSIWIGVLVIKGKQRDNRLKDLDIAEKERQQQADEAHG